MWLVDGNQLDPHTRPGVWVPAHSITSLYYNQETMIIEYESPNGKEEVIEHFDRVSYDPIKKILRATRGHLIGDDNRLSMIFESGYVTVRGDNNKEIRTYYLGKRQHELIIETP